MARNSTASCQADHYRAPTAFCPCQAFVRSDPPWRQHRRSANPGRPRRRATPVVPISTTNCGYRGHWMSTLCAAVLLAHANCQSFATFEGETVQESPAVARVTRDSAVIPRWPSAAILDIIEPKIAPFDPPTPKTLA